MNREELVKRLSNYIREEMIEQGFTPVYEILCKALCEAITKPAEYLDEYWLGALSSQIYAVTTDGIGPGDDAYCYQIEVELGESLGIPPVGLFGSLKEIVNSPELVQITTA